MNPLSFPFEIRIRAVRGMREKKRLKLIRLLDEVARYDSDKEIRELASCVLKKMKAGEDEELATDPAFRSSLH